ncbi:MAG: hypothetical protein ACXVAX_00630 [Pseudobdellovibrio sp.]
MKSKHKTSKNFISVFITSTFIVSSIALAADKPATLAGVLETPKESVNPTNSTPHVLMTPKTFDTLYSKGVTFDPNIYKQLGPVKQKNDTANYAPPGVTIPCNIKASELTYAGLNFVGTAECIYGATEKDAKHHCNSGNLVNPANKQYGKGSADRVGNPDNYYYCMYNDPSYLNEKATLCQSVAGIYADGIQFKWVPAAGTNNRDGDCYCGAKGTDIPTNDSAFRCEQNVPTAVQASGEQCTRLGLDADPRPASQKTEGERQTTTCKCKDKDQYFPLATAQQSCNAAHTAGVSGTGTTGNADFQACLNNWQTISKKCSDDSDKAKNACKEVKKNNETSNAVADVVGAMGSVGTAMNAGTGSQQACFKASVLGLAARDAIKATQATCNNDFNDCKNDCTLSSDETKSKYDTFVAECRAKLGDQADQLLAADNTGPDAQAYRRIEPIVRNNFEHGMQVCTVDTKGFSDQMGQLFNDVGNSLQSSLKCACSLSSTNNSTNSQNTNCSLIPNPNTCDTTNAAGCSVYGALGACEMGSTSYDAKTCSCLQNPGSCSTTAGTGPSLFGGNLSQMASSGNGSGGGLGSTGSGGSLGNFDLGGGNGGSGDTPATMAAGISGAMGPAPSGSSGGGGGGGGRGGGNGDLNDPNAAPKEEKGMSGLFNQARNFMASAFGSGSGKKGTSGPGNGDSKIDTSKFKPRGMASTKGDGQIGTPNMDIFMMMKMCAIGETCASNQNKNNWIIGP